MRGCSSHILELAIMNATFAFAGGKVQMTLEKSEVASRDPQVMAMSKSYSVCGEGGEDLGPFIPLRS